MNKKFLLVSFVVVIFGLLTYNLAFAVVNQPFGGRIIGLKAKEIDSLEKSNYKCIVPGSTIEINPIKGNRGYFIPQAVSKSFNMLRTNQYIMGLYAGQTAISCIFQGTPPHTKIVMLNNVKLYGTSKR